MDLKSLFCALSHADDNHFLIKPVTLLCGHAVCYSCIGSLKRISCEICKKENLIDLDVVAESSIAKSLIDKSLDELFVEIKKRFERLFNQFEVNVQNSIDHFDRFLMYAKEEIDVKVESLKAEIDLMKASIIKKMEDFRSELKR